MALAEFAAIETLDGTVMLPLEVRATVVAPGAGLLKVAVQTATPAGASVVGLQLIPLRTEDMVLLAVPPVALIGSASPFSMAPSAPEIPTVAEAAARVTDTVATTPLPI